MRAVTLGGELPHGGQEFSASVSGDEIAVRVGDLICVAHKRWMTRDEARHMADALLAVAADR